MNTSNQKRVMSMAHYIYKNQKPLEPVSFFSKNAWGDSLILAWRILRVREALTKGALYLTYYKGIEIQCRRGTLNAAYIPGNQMPKGIREQEISEGLTKENWGVINYYDLDKQGWRSFKITHLCKATPITVVTTYTLTHVGESIYSA